MEATRKVLVWDTPTRVFHWLMALSFFGAYLTSESSRYLAVHLTLGYTMVGLVAFRLVWGLIGTRYARFSNFIRGPKAVAKYASTMFKSRPEHQVGHNPLGAVSIVLMLAATPVVVYTGWVYFNGGNHTVKELHESAAGLMLAVVGVHMAGVLLASVMQRENLAGAMLTGHKNGVQTEAIRWSWWPLGLAIAAAVLFFWWTQWQNPPSAVPSKNGMESQRFAELAKVRNKRAKHDSHKQYTLGD